MEADHPFIIQITTLGFYEGITTGCSYVHKIPRRASLVVILEDDTKLPLAVGICERHLRNPNYNSTEALDREGVSGRDSESDSTSMQEMGVDVIVLSVSAKS